jgi:protein involved in polysaccharide export with SLBB domain
MRLLRMEMRRNLCALCSLAVAVMLTACGSPPPPTKTPVKEPSPEEVERILHSEPLHIGDKVRVELSGIPDKMEPMDRDIKDDGSINLPFINNIAAAGKTPSQLEKDIKAAYEPKWFLHVTVTVTHAMRFFYVTGMVNSSGNGGRIVYTGPITVLGAIAAAGDFNPYARRTHVQITRFDGKIEYENCVKAVGHPELDLLVHPGDRITVPRRLW